MYQGHQSDLADKGVMPEERVGKLVQLRAHREEALPHEPLEQTTLLRVSANCQSRKVHNV
jgi:hypothetical protein